MYLVPYNFVDKKEIKFPKNYQRHFKTFKNANEVLLAYAETMILLQQWDELYKKIKHKKINVKAILKIKKQLTSECFITPHKSIMFYSKEMLDQFEYIYYLLLSSYRKLSKLI